MNITRAIDTHTESSALPAPRRTPLLRLSWAAQAACAAILAQTLFFKFTWAPETQVIFRDLGGRPAATFAGLIELACVALLLTRRWSFLGAALALSTILGAIAAHVLVIGIVIVDPATGRGDGGLLFGLALAVAALSGLVLALRRHEVVAWLRRRSATLAALLGR